MRTGYDRQRCASAYDMAPRLANRAYVPRRGPLSIGGFYKRREPETPTVAGVRKLGQTQFIQ